MDRRTELLEGVMSFPQQIHDLVRASKHDKQEAERMLQSLYTKYLNGDTVTSLTAIADRFHDIFTLNNYLKHLSKAGWIISRSKISGRKNWAEVELNSTKLAKWLTHSEVNYSLRNVAINHYILDNTSLCEEYEGAEDVKLPSGVQETGISRMGSAYAGNTHEFMYDTAKMKEYFPQIVDFTLESMKKMEKELGYSLILDNKADYQSVVTRILQHHVLNPSDKYTLGKLTSDSRGRSIYDAVKRVFNPISNKVARALVVCPEYTIETADLKEIYLFISEMLHGHNYDIKAKAQKGRQAFLNRDLPSAEDDLHERIWLERVYDQLTQYNRTTPRTSYQFTVPGELDFGASNMVIIGCLLNHKPLLTEYMWTIEGLSKLHVKKAETPYVFGSSAPVRDLWNKASLEYTNKDIALMEYHMTRGKFAIPNMFKDLIINNCNLSEKQFMHVDNEKFYVECNKYKNVGDTTKCYQLYDTATDRIHVVKHTNTHKVADLKQFKRYPVTGLIHNLDSQIMDEIAWSLTWTLPIFDACVTPFNQFRPMRVIGTRRLENIRKHRGRILTNYFTSIGFTGYKPLKEYNKLKAMCTPLEGSINPYHILK